ncbi:MAG: tetratricopeptide repeat protein [Alistipes sp.]|nr:tetratricopeptide repeat protein [Alistipes sp.]
MHRLLYILCLFAFLGASAQRMPERSEVRKGNRHYNKGDYKTAIERYTRALGHAPESFEATYDLGNALYKAEMFDKAEQTMARAAADTLRTDAERAEALYNLGNAQFKQQKYKEALESYRRSLLLDPTDMEAKYNYAYTKKLLEQDQDQNGGGGSNDQQQNQDDRNQNNQNQDSKDDQQNDGEGRQTDDESGNGEQDPAQPDDGQEGDGQPQPLPAGISEQEQQQMLDAIQAQEDKTQDKLKEKQGVIVRGKKNW